jgi:putative spermidine/putrescine transport system ATP-binding protein
VGTTNTMAGEVIDAHAGSCRVRLATGELIATSNCRGMRDGDKVIISIRPEHLRLGDEPAPSALAGEVKAVLPLGSNVMYEVAAGGTAIKVNASRGVAEQALRPVGERVYAVPVSAAACLVFPKQ